MGDSSDEFQDASCSLSRFIHHCGKCEISFSSSSSLRKHNLRLHQASCPVCPFKGTIGAVKAHRRLEHTRKERGQECVEKNAAGLPCGEKFLTLAKLRAHLASQHDISAATHCIKEQFASETEFREWKGAYESNIGAQYTQRAGAVGQIKYFECSRSGIHKPDKKAQNGRKPKSQGSSKIGRRCTSTMTARTKEDGTVLVDVHPFHYGHCLGLPHLPHLRIPTQDKAAIKDKLRNGVSMTRIIQDIRKQHGEVPSTNRTYWLARKDLRNMSASMGISAQGADMKSNNEVYSVAMYAEEIRSSDQQHLLTLKMPGESDPDGELRDEDFVFGFCTSAQLAMFVKHGAKVVCMDGTHGTSGHDFHLITLLVISEFGTGLPVAWLISSREDEAAVGKLLRGLKDACQEQEVPFPNVSYLMTDKAMAFYNAWLRVTGQPTQHLLCAWHVQKAWRSKLPMVTDTDVRQEIYDALSGILFEADNDRAQQAMEELVMSLVSHANTRSFGEYLEAHWLGCVPKWVLGNRRAEGLSTNMHVEAFHRVLKYLYLDGRVNKRVDKCIAALQRFAEDQMVTLSKRQIWGTPSYKQAKNAKRHDVAATLVTQSKAYAHTIPNSDGAAWSVRVEVTGQQTASTYVVQIEHRRCPMPDCREQCTECKICSHQLRCSCPDWVIQKTVCKHIHIACITHGIGKSLSSGSLQLATDISTPTTVSDRQYMAVNADQHSPTTPSEHDRPEHIARRTALANRIIALGRMAPRIVDGIEDEMLGFIATKTRELEEAFKLAQTRTTAAAANTSLPPSANQPWNKRPAKQPAFRPKKRRGERQTVAPAESEEARAAVAALCQKDVGRERRNKASDHTYLRGQ